MADLESAGIGAAITAALAAAAHFINRAFGDPEARMKHAERLAKAEQAAELAAVAVLERQAKDLASRLDALQGRQEQQARLQADLERDNRELRTRVAALEEQAATDADTIATLQRELSEARTQLASAQAALERAAGSCVADCPKPAKPASKKKGRK